MVYIAELQGYNLPQISVKLYTKILSEEDTNRVNDKFRTSQVAE